MTIGSRAGLSFPCPAFDRSSCRRAKRQIGQIILRIRIFICCTAQGNMIPCDGRQGSRLSIQ